MKTLTKRESTMKTLGGRRLKGVLGLSLNDTIIPFPVDKTVSVG